MIGYVTLGTNDLQKSSKFYDTIAKELGTSRMMENEHFIAYGNPGGSAGIGITKPYDGQCRSEGDIEDLGQSKP
jgi:hypothetical protein